MFSEIRPGSICRNGLPTKTRTCTKSHVPGLSEVAIVEKSFTDGLTRRGAAHTMFSRLHNCNSRICILERLAGRCAE
jgi:hypothetical protein